MYYLASIPDNANLLPRSGWLANHYQRSSGTEVPITADADVFSYSVADLRSGSDGQGFVGFVLAHADGWVTARSIFDNKVRDIPSADWQYHI